MTEMIIDFRSIDKNRELFTGRKNGERARTQRFQQIESSDIDRIVLRAGPEQLITSSYFLGLLGKKPSEFKSLKEALEHIDVSGLGKTAKNECERALQRAFGSNRGLI